MGLFDKLLNNKSKKTETILGQNPLLTDMLQYIKERIDVKDYVPVPNLLRDLGEHMAKRIIIEAGLWEIACTDKNGKQYSDPNYANCVRLLRNKKLIDKDTYTNVFVKIKDLGNPGSHHIGVAKEYEIHYVYEKTKEYVQEFIKKYPDAARHDILPDPKQYQPAPNKKAATHQHKRSDWIVVRQPTCSTEGEKHIVCTDCKAVLERKSIPKTDHDLAWFIEKEPSSVSTGFRCQKCRKCGKILNRTVIPCIKPNDPDRKLSRTNEAKPAYDSSPSQKAPSSIQIVNNPSENGNSAKQTSHLSLSDAPAITELTFLNELSVLELSALVNEAELGKFDMLHQVLLKYAVEKNNISAQRMLGFQYEHGMGCERDYSTAFDWYQRAAQQGDPDSQYSLAKLYEQGLGCRRDLEQAFLLLKRSAGQGNKKAQTALDNLAFRKHDNERISASSVFQASPVYPAKAVSVSGNKTYDVTIISVGPEKIKVIKIVRELTGLGLKEAKDLVDHTPKVIAECVSNRQAIEIASNFQSVGARCEVIESK